MSSGSIEERIAKLEREVERLKCAPPANSKATTPWWEKIAGTFAGSEDHEEAMRLGREYRESQRPNDDEIAA
jgi:hypothetical protein